MHETLFRSLLTLSEVFVSLTISWRHILHHMFLPHITTFVRKFFRSRLLPTEVWGANQLKTEPRSYEWASVETVGRPRPESLTSLVADATPDLLLLYDVALGGCIYVNRWLSSALGFSLVEVEKMGDALFKNLLHPEDFPTFSENLVRLARLGDGDVYETEYRFRHLNGEWRWFHCRATVFVRDPQGAPGQILYAARDVTEHRKIEEAQRQSEVFVALNRLIAHLAHEINNPLANVKNSLFLLRNALLPNHPDAKYLRWSEEEIERIAQAVRQISTTSHPNG